MSQSRKVTNNVAAAGVSKDTQAVNAELVDDQAAQVQVRTLLYSLPPILAY